MISRETISLFSVFHKHNCSYEFVLCLNVLSVTQCNIGNVLQVPLIRRIAWTIQNSKSKKFFSLSLFSFIFSLMALKQLLCMLNEFVIFATMTKATLIFISEIDDQNYLTIEIHGLKNSLIVYTKSINRDLCFVENNTQ